MAACHTVQHFAERVYSSQHWLHRLLSFLSLPPSLPLSLSLSTLTLTRHELPALLPACRRASAWFPATRLSFSPAGLSRLTAPRAHNRLLSPRLRSHGQPRHRAAERVARRRGGVPALQADRPHPDPRPAPHPQEARSVCVACVGSACVACLLQDCVPASPSPSTDATNTRRPLPSPAKQAGCLCACGARRCSLGAFLFFDQSCRCASLPLRRCAPTTARRRTPSTTTRSPCIWQSTTRSLT